jgi:hypothetical protein
MKSNRSGWLGVTMFNFRVRPSAKAFAASLPDCISALDAAFRKASHGAMAFIAR